MKINQTNGSETSFTGWRVKNQRANNQRSRAAIYSFLSVLTLLAVFGVGCSSDSQYSASAASDHPDDAELFSIPQDQMAHIQIVTVKPTTLLRTLRLTGAVAFNGFDTTPVITQVSGPVSRIVALPGENVRRGQVLLYVASPDFSQARATYLKASDTYQIADKEYARTKDLYEHHAAAERDLLMAESARTQAQADLQTSEQALRILGFSTPQEALKAPSSAEIPVFAPIAGEVVERLVAPGQVIQAGATQAFTISNMSTVWVLANVYQQDFPYVHNGDPVEITTDAYPDMKFNGTISYISPELDATTRTLQARIVVKNPQDKLKKDMYVTAQVQAGKTANSIVVPNASILRDAENEPFVYTLTGSNQFARRSVSLGETEGGNTQINKGLSFGDRVVGDGSLFLQFANSLQH